MRGFFRPKSWIWLEAQLTYGNRNPNSGYLKLGWSEDWLKKGTMELSRVMKMPYNLIGVTQVRAEKDAQLKSWELCFIWGHYWGLYSPRSSLSHNSEELFRRYKGGARIYRNFSWKKNRNKYVVKQQKIAANPTHTQNLFLSWHLKLMILVLFYVWRATRVRVFHYCFDTHFNCLETVVSLSSSWNPLRMLLGGLQWLMTWCRA